MQLFHTEQWYLDTPMPLLYVIVALVLEKNLTLLGSSLVVPVGSFESFFMFRLSTNDSFVGVGTKMRLAI